MSGNPYQRANPSLQKQRAVGRASEAAYEQGAMRASTLPQAYPYPVWAKDPRDTTQAIRGELLDDPGISGSLVINNTDVDYILTKRQQEEAIAKDLWVSSLFDMTRPEVVRHVKSIMPDFFDRQKSYFDAAMDAAKTFTRINMQGIQSKEDIDFLWHVKTGVIHVPSGFLPHQLLAPLPESLDGPADPDAFTAFVRGPFSWYRSAHKRAVTALPGFNPANQINPFSPPHVANNTSHMFDMLYNAYGMPNGSYTTILNANGAPRSAIAANRPGAYANAIRPGSFRAFGTSRVNQNILGEQVAEAQLAGRGMTEAEARQFARDFPEATRVADARVDEARARAAAPAAAPGQ